MELKNFCFDGVFFTGQVLGEPVTFQTINHLELPGIIN